MKISDIKCNGIGYTVPARGVKPLISNAIAIFRMRHTTSRIFEMFPEGDYHPGKRFSSNDDVIERILSGIVEAAHKKYIKSNIHIISTEDNAILSGHILSFVNSLSGSKMDLLILEGMRDCASADHWYTFEKQWD
jgi:hypothetical protein